VEFELVSFVQFKKKVEKLIFMKCKTKGMGL